MFTCKFEDAGPTAVLAVTGRGIDGIKFIEKGMIWPFQKAHHINLQPANYNIELQAMTKEKLQLEVPVVFLIGPDCATDGNDHYEVDNIDAITRYATLLSGKSERSKTHLADIVTGIIEGETRVIVSTMTMEEISQERDVFRRRINQGIEPELRQFGLKLYNVNIKELTDAPGSDYFKIIAQKAHTSAANIANVDVAHATYMGTVGEAEKRGLQQREIAKIDAETAVAKTERDTEKAKAEALYATRKVAFDKDVHVAQIEASRATETVDEELKKQVEIRRAQTEVERLRASDVVKATILRESKQQAADAKAYEMHKAAETKAYEMHKAAEADQFKEQKTADARAYKTRIDCEAAVIAHAKDAESKLYRKTKEAEGLLIAHQKEAEGHLIRKQKEAEGRLIQAQQDGEGYLIRQQKEAEGRLIQAQKDGEGHLIRQQKEAEGRLIQAQKDAEGRLAQQAKEAEGLTKMAEAYGKMSRAFGGPQGLIQYLMIEKGVYGDLARANATAVQGMQPKMTIWNTGSGNHGEGVGADPGATIRNTYQMLPPLMSTIHEQTGLQLPAWQFGKLGGAVGEVQSESPSESTD